MYTEGVSTEPEYIDALKRLPEFDGVVSVDTRSKRPGQHPCFEFWLIIHHRHHTGPLSTDEAIRLRRELDGSDGKHLDGALYLKLVDDAIRRARALRRKHREESTNFPDDNPASSFDQLVSHIREVARVHR